MNRMTNGRRVFLLALLLGAGCGGSDGGDMGDMPGMSGGPAESPGEAVDNTAAMRAHMQRLSSLTPDSMHAVMPEHRQMVANMLAQMNREMSSMNMGADLGWTATVDSIRSDLTSMPNMTADEMAAMVAAHRARVERLMSMHQAMMGRM